MATLHQTIELFQPGPAFGVRSPSPFCLKVETWLRLADVAYRAVPTLNPTKGPTGKVPFIRLRGSLLGDSELIIDALAAATGRDLDDGLDGLARAQATAVAGMLEERLYWPMVYERWFDPACWTEVRNAFFGGLPLPIRAALPPILRRRVMAQLRAQGIGRHSHDQIIAFAKRDIAALSVLLADQPYFHGSSPARVDAALYGFLANLISVDLDGALNRFGREQANLVAYVARMEERCFGGVVGVASALSDAA